MSQSTWQVSFLACNWKGFFYASIFIILLQTKSLTFPGRDLSVCHQMDQVSTSYTGICDKLNSFNLSLLLSIVASTLHIVHKVFLKAFESSHWMWIILHLILMPGLFDRHENPAKKKICYSLLKAVNLLWNSISEACKFLMAYFNTSITVHSWRMRWW